MVIDILEIGTDTSSRYFSSAICRFQSGIIGPIDNYAKFASEFLICIFQHEDYSVPSRVCWSKRVCTESDSPDKILLDALNP